MSAKPFDVGPVIARLRDRAIKPGGLRLVEGRGAYAQLKSINDFPVPCAYVMLATERGMQTKTGMSIPGQQHPLSQQMFIGIGVVMAFRNHRGLEGDELRDELRDQVGAVRDVLLGWTPPGAGAQLQLEGGDLEDYSAGTALWADRYTTHHFIKPEITP